MVLLNDKIVAKIKEDLLLTDPNIIPNINCISPGQRLDNLNAVKSQISHASYNIRVGKKYTIESKDYEELSDYRSIIIKPFEVAIIETYEKINMPNNLIARWNIKVGLAYEGLIWVGGPQVDPGYSGHLYCPIYNLSDKEVKLKYKDPIATIDFVKTTEPTSDSTSFDQNKVKPFEFYKNKNLKSALITNVQTKMKELDEFKDKMEERLHKLQTTFLTVIGALFATLSILIISMKSDNSPTTYGIVVYLAFGISIFSLLLHNKDIGPLVKIITKLLGYGIIFLVIAFLILFAYDYVN